MHCHACHPLVTYSARMGGGGNCGSVGYRNWSAHKAHVAPHIQIDIAIMLFDNYVRSLPWKTALEQSLYPILRMRAAVITGKYVIAS